MMAFTICGNALHQLIADEAGQDLVEYALIAVLIGLGAVAAMKNLASNIATVFVSAGTTLTSSV